MVILSKFVSAFLLPPGLFVVLLGVLAWFLRPQARETRGGKARERSVESLARSFKGSGGGFVLACGGAALCYLLSIEPVADLLLKPLEDRYPALPAQGVEKCAQKAEGAGRVKEGIAQESKESGALKEWRHLDAVVVLGGGTVSGSPEKGSDDLRAEPLKRLLYGVRIYREVKKDRTSKTYLILSGGRVFDVGQEAEAVIMGRYASEWDVEPGSILLEPDSRTTWQNARNVATRFRPRKIILVTSAYHMPRAMWCFTRQGVEVIPAPTDYKANRGVPYDLESFLPTLEGFQNVRRALHEYLGSFLYGVSYR